jgi:hypothetical protein
VAVVVADRFVQVYDDRGRTRIARCVAPTTCLHCRVSAGRGRYTAFAKRGPKRAVDFDRQWSPVPPNVRPVSAGASTDAVPGDVGFLIIAFAADRFRRIRLCSSRMYTTSIFLMHMVGCDDGECKGPSCWPKSTSSSSSSSIRRDYCVLYLPVVRTRSPKKKEGSPAPRPTFPLYYWFVRRSLLLPASCRQRSSLAGQDRPENREGSVPVLRQRRVLFRASVPFFDKDLSRHSPNHQRSGSTPLFAASHQHRRSSFHSRRSPRSRRRCPHVGCCFAFVSNQPTRKIGPLVLLSYLTPPQFSYRPTHFTTFPSFGPTLQKVLSVDETDGSSGRPFDRPDRPDRSKRPKRPNATIAFLARPKKSKARAEPNERLGAR